MVTLFFMVFFFFPMAEGLDAGNNNGTEAGTGGPSAAINTASADSPSLTAAVLSAISTYQTGYARACP